MQVQTRDRRIFRQRLVSGEPLVGAFCPAAAPELIEVAAFAGFDFTVIDAEHGPITIADVVHMVRAGHATDVPVMVRVPEYSADFVMRSLDAGADGIMLPQVETAAEVRRLYEAMHYPPLGKRGLAFYARAHHFSRNTGLAAVESANSRVVTGILVETPRGVENIDEIVAAEGLDLVLMGTGDLAGHYGFGPDTDRRVDEAVTRVVEACKRRKVAAAIAVHSADAAGKYASRGYQVIATGLLPPLLRVSTDFVNGSRQALVGA